MLIFIYYPPYSIPIKLLEIFDKILQYFIFCDIIYQEIKNKEVKRLNKIQLLKEPGYIYDLNFIFCLKFNANLYMNDLPNDDKKDSTIKYFKDILNHFSDIPDDLYIFFHALETGRTFLASYYFKPYRKQFSTTYNFKFLQKELSDQDKLIRNVIKFYFNELDDEKIPDYSTGFRQVVIDSKISDQSKQTIRSTISVAGSSKLLWSDSSAQLDL